MTAGHALPADLRKDLQGPMAAMLSGAEEAQLLSKVEDNHKVTEESPEDSDSELQDLVYSTDEDEVQNGAPRPAVAAESEGSDGEGDLVCRVAGPCDNMWIHGGGCSKDECCEASPPTPMDNKFTKPSVAAVAKTVEKLLNDVGISRSGLQKMRKTHGL